MKNSAKNRWILKDLESSPPVSWVRPSSTQGVLCNDCHKGICQNYGPFLGPYYNAGPNTGPNLGDPKSDHDFDNPLQSLIIQASIIDRSKPVLQTLLTTWTPKVCKIMAFMAIIRGLGLLVYILLGFR